MLVYIVYAHPRHDCLTGDLLDAFVGGLTQAGHQHTISDLYRMGFNPVLSQAEYERESRFDAGSQVSADVAAEQAKLDAADVWAFVYPVWWTDCPAILKGWFDRVWAVGWAYNKTSTNPAEARLAHGPGAASPTKKALVLCTAGNPENELRESGCLQAMKTVMLGDRINDRTDQAEFHLFAGSTAATAEDRQALRQHHLAVARNLGVKLLGEQTSR